MIPEEDWYCKFCDEERNAVSRLARRTQNRNNSRSNRSRNFDQSLLQRLFRRNNFQAQRNSYPENEHILTQSSEFSDANELTNSDEIVSNWRSHLRNRRSEQSNNTRNTSHRRNFQIRNLGILEEEFESNSDRINEAQRATLRISQHNLNPNPRNFTHSLSIDSLGEFRFPSRQNRITHS